MGGGALSALRLQDLPAEHVIAFMGMPPGYKQATALKLFSMASGMTEDSLLSRLTFGELEHMMEEWMIASAESEEVDPDGTGKGLNWDEPPTE